LAFANGEPVHLKTPNTEVFKRFEEAVRPLQEEHRQAILDAESIYAAIVSRPITRWAKRNDSYWDTWGPSVIGFVMAQREKFALEQLMEKTENLDAVFFKRMQEVEKEFFPEGVF
jgi:hypothetical protein